jgi:hypothetical protein
MENENMTTEINSGLAWHVHHEIMIEWCYDLDERLDYIKSNKPSNEISTRIKCFSLLTQRSIDSLPADLNKADADWRKASADLNKADADWRKADADWRKADREFFHTKFCGCTEWNGETLVFPNGE